MERREAILVFREICETIPDMILANCVLLKRQIEFSDPLQTLYELHIRTSVDRPDLERIRAIADKHSMQVEETGKYIVIHAAPANEEGMAITV